MCLESDLSHSFKGKEEEPTTKAVEISNQSTVMKLELSFGTRSNPEAKVEQARS